MTMMISSNTRAYITAIKKYKGAPMNSINTTAADEDQAHPGVHLDHRARQDSGRDLPAKPLTIRGAAQQFAILDNHVTP